MQSPLSAAATALVSTLLAALLAGPGAPSTAASRCAFVRAIAPQPFRAPLAPKRTIGQAELLAGFDALVAGLHALEPLFAAQGLDIARITDAVIAALDADGTARAH